MVWSSPTCEPQVWHKPHKTRPCTKLRINQHIKQKITNSQLPQPIAYFTSIQFATTRLINDSINRGLNQSYNKNRIANVAFVDDHTYSKCNLSVSIVNNINRVSKNEATIIERRTRRQALSPIWKKYRRSRITASMAFYVMRTAKCGNYSECYAKQIVSGKNVTSKAIQWGKRNEIRALKQYENITRQKVENAGLFIDSFDNFLGASPDGVIKDIPKLIEIKCPYTHRYLPVQQMPFWDENGNLKKNHSYYTQCQIQMHVTNIHKIDLVIWTMNEIGIKEINYDEDYVESILIWIKEYYERIFCPLYIKHFSK